MDNARRRLEQLCEDVDRKLAAEQNNSGHTSTCPVVSQTMTEDEEKMTVTLETVTEDPRTGHRYYGYIVNSVAPDTPDTGMTEEQRKAEQAWQRALWDEDMKQIQERTRAAQEQ